MIARFIILLLAFATTAPSEWLRALPGKTYEFPRDHFAHPDFQSEWWYFTGHLKDAAENEFGFQITFFRSGVRDPKNRKTATSKFVTDAFFFGHFGLAKITDGSYSHQQVVSRGTHNQSGEFQEGTRICFIEDWTLDLIGENTFHAKAENLDLTFTAKKPTIFNGIDGASQKAEGKGNASHYYSITRLETKGTLDGQAVSGQSWLDREWGTSQLGEGQVGWDWFSIQFEDNTELMIYQIREADGTPSPYSSGTYTDQAGKSIHLTSENFTLTPTTSLWKSPHTKGEYPLSWSIEIPSLSLSLKTSTSLKNQEFAEPAISYWEGAIEVSGSKLGKGYLELTGYTGALPGF